MPKDYEVTKDIIGVPTLAFFPARNYKFKVHEEKHKLIIPRKGSFVELDPNFYSEEDGDFCIIPDDFSWLNVQLITKVLFAAHSYPALEDDQLFCPIHFKFVNDTIEIIGQVLTMLNE